MHFYLPVVVGVMIILKTSDKNVTVAGKNIEK